MCFGGVKVAEEEGKKKRKGKREKEGEERGKGRKEREGRREGWREEARKRGKNKLYLISSTKTVFAALTSHLPVAWHGFTASKPAEILEVKIQYNNWLTDLKKDRQIFSISKIH